MAETTWTLDVLIGKVVATLDLTAYAGAPNGRVREVPDARAVRWYSTIGLVDRPVMQGRTALYGPRHLAQLVAIKRLQSQGHKLADIQAELAGAPDDVLMRIAEMPFWKAQPAAHVPRVVELPAAAPRVVEIPAAAPRVVERPAAPEEQLITGVPLGGGAVLLLPATPGEDDVARIRGAARELMDVLHELGLIATQQADSRGSAE
ncbi:MerR family transcriptional regulator [Dactylosporangium sp. NPDC051485]|uniref:MerR family transcriptional regulator n=1 Tax=Dactylosporangium sp. NPDC051485 TaxID=3154846 RepID=UPI00341EA848